MTGRHTVGEEITRVVDVDTLSAAVRELAAGHDSVTVIVQGKAGAVLGVLRTRTAAELVGAAHVSPRVLKPPFRAAPEMRLVEPDMAELDEEDADEDLSDPRYGAVSTPPEPRRRAGDRGEPEPVGLLSEQMRRASDWIGYGKGAP